MRTTFLYGLILSAASTSFSCANKQVPTVPQPPQQVTQPTPIVPLANHEPTNPPTKEPEHTLATYLFTTPTSPLKLSEQDKRTNTTVYINNTHYSIELCLDPPDDTLLVIIKNNVNPAMLIHDYNADGRCDLGIQYSLPRTQNGKIYSRTLDIGLEHESFFQKEYHHTLNTLFEFYSKKQK